MTLDPLRGLVHFGVVTVSDRASTGVYADRGGPAISAFLAEHVGTPHELHPRLVPDDVDTIASTIIELTDSTNCCFV